MNWSQFGGSPEVFFEGQLLPVKAGNLGWGKLSLLSMTSTPVLGGHCASVAAFGEAKHTLVTTTGNRVWNNSIVTSHNYNHQMILYKLI